MLGRLLVPSMVAAIGLAAGDMADAVVIGQRMGATGLAAVSLALPVFMMINVLVHGLGIGGSVRYSKYMGEGKEEKAVENFNQILLAGLTVSAFLAAFGNLFLAQVMALLGVKKDAGDALRGQPGVCPHDFYRYAGSVYILHSELLPAKR